MREAKLAKFLIQEPTVASNLPAHVSNTRGDFDQKEKRPMEAIGARTW